MAMEFEGKPLIREIKKRPILYDKSTANYSNLTQRRKAWIEVCQALIKDWNQWDSAEQERAILQANKRWQNMRNCFQRELKTQKTEQVSARKSRRKKYYYYDDMVFLIGNGYDADKTNEVQEASEEEADDDGNNDVADDDGNNDDGSNVVADEEVNENDQSEFRKSKLKLYYTVDLIDAVKNEPTLYDKSLKADDVSKSEAWKRVAAAVYMSLYYTWKSSERDEAVKYLKLRWCNIRTCYLRELKMQLARNARCKDPGKIRREYVYNKNLVFLTPHMNVGRESKKTGGNEKQTKQRGVSEDESEHDQHVEYLEDFDDFDDDHNYEDDVPEEKPKLSVKRHNEEKPQIKRLKKFKSEGEKPEELEVSIDPLNLQQRGDKIESIDQDVNFALSLVPMLKKLSATRKLEAQIQILNVFKKFSNN